MSDDQKITDTLSQLASDLSYFKSLANDEREKIKGAIDEKINVSKDPYSHLPIVCDVLVSSLGELSARVKMLETVIVSKGGESAGHGKFGAVENNMALLEEIDVGAEQFASDANMYGLEQSDIGISYSWSGPDPKTSFILPVLRNQNKVFRLRFLSAIDDSLLELAKVYIDGELAKHEIEFDGQCKNVVVKLPKLEDKAPTTFLLDLGRTISPAEKGNGADQRCLGLAIAGYTIANS